MVLVKKSTIFLYVFFLAKQAKKKDFLMFWMENKVCWTTKVNFSQSRKNRHTAKGLVHGVRQKIVLFLMCFFSQKSQKQTFFYILDSKECFFDPKSEILAKSKKSTFFKGVSQWFLSKNWPFSHMFFLATKGRKKDFWYSG